MSRWAAVREVMIASIAWVRFWAIVEACWERRARWGEFEAVDDRIVLWNFSRARQRALAKPLRIVGRRCVKVRSQEVERMRRMGAVS
jgi:hypothetical protein